MAMYTHIIPDEFDAWFVDRDGVPSFAKHEDDVLSYTIDYTDWLGSETISTSTWTVDGVTNDSDSNTTTTTTITVSKTGGEAKNTITTSGSRTFVRRLRFYDPVLQ